MSVTALNNPIKHIYVKSIIVKHKYISTALIRDSHQCPIGYVLGFLKVLYPRYDEVRSVSTFASRLEC